MLSGTLAGCCETSRPVNPLGPVGLVTALAPVGRMEQRQRAGWAGLAMAAAAHRPRDGTVV